MKFKHFVSPIPRLRKIRDRMKAFKQSNRGQRFQLVHHLCDEEDVPTDALGDPLKFAVPRGEGGPIERMEAGDISWQACLVWIVLKFFSNWQTGETHEMNRKTLASYCNMSKGKLGEAIKELKKAGMLEQLSKPWEASRFQLYPQPPEKTETQRRREKHTRKQGKEIKEGKWQIYVNETHAYSGNRQYRLRFEDGRIEKRAGKKNWKEIGNKEKFNIPYIVEPLEQALQARIEISSNLGGSHSDTPNPHSDTPDPDSDTPSKWKGYRPAWERG
ncbi:MAG: hypothetical protein OXM61_16050 [Candidatus Poribacteria bacterium]|nr:hypothetical protein [Candidatus Poribacteria bacterium]